MEKLYGQVHDQTITINKLIERQFKLIKNRENRRKSLKIDEFRLKIN